MNLLTFEFWECTGRTLFSPSNDLAKELCKTMRRKNLSDQEIEFYHNQGYKIELRPKITFRESIRGLVVNGN